MNCVELNSQGKTWRSLRESNSSFQIENLAATKPHQHVSQLSGAKSAQAKSNACIATGKHGETETLARKPAHEVCGAPTPASDDPGRLSHKESSRFVDRHGRAHSSAIFEHLSPAMIRAMGIRPVSEEEARAR
jgi:hypothetical protein